MTRPPISSLTDASPMSRDDILGHLIQPRRLTDMVQDENIFDVAIGQSLRPLNDIRGVPARSGQWVNHEETPAKTYEYRAATEITNIALRQASNVQIDLPIEGGRRLQRLGAQTCDAAHFQFQSLLIGHT